MPVILRAFFNYQEKKIDAYISTRKISRGFARANMIDIEMSFGDFAMLVLPGKSAKLPVGGDSEIVSIYKALLGIPLFSLPLALCPFAQYCLSILFIVLFQKMIRK